MEPGPEWSARSIDDAARHQAKRLRGWRWAYRVCEGLTEGLLYALVILGPWVLGATPDWAVWAMNAIGYALGALLLTKWVIRSRTGCQTEARTGQATGRYCASWGAWLVRAMAALTVLLLAYCLVSALNARAAYHYGQFHLEYFEYVPWLPHSFDRERTWFCFWQYLGLAAVFWASRDWLLGRTSNKTQQELSADPPSTIRHISPPVLPRRLRRVLLVLCASGSLLAVESVVQRLAGSDKTLFFFQPNFPDADMVFGPFAYRGNASQYFNLVWPVCAVLAWTMGRASRHAYRVGARKPGRAHWWLAAGAILMGACPAISTCRGGAIVAGAQLVLVLCVLLGAIRPSSWQSRLGALLLVLLAVQAAMVLGLDRLAPRLEMMFLDRLSGRLDLYQQAERIAKDYPWFGTGPGSFALVYKFYRARPEDYWAAQAHDDWLETRVTFGWIGFITILLLLLLAPLTWLVGTGAGIRVPWHLPAALLVAMAGCLFHARFDFPLQIHSILALLVFYCAVLSCLEQRQARGARASAPGGSQIH